MITNGASVGGGVSFADTMQMQDQVFVILRSVRLEICGGLVRIQSPRIDIQDPREFRGWCVQTQVLLRRNASPKPKTLNLKLR